MGNTFPDSRPFSGVSVSLSVKTDIHFCVPKYEQDKVNLSLEYFTDSFFVIVLIGGIQSEKSV